MTRLPRNVTKFMPAIAAACALLAGVDAQSCGIPGGNPGCGSSTTSQSSPNPFTGVGNPIDLTTGNKYEQETDIEMPGDLSIGFTRHYNSLLGQSGVLGSGWSHTYETRLSRTETPAGSGAQHAAPPHITVMQGDGRVISFEQFETTSSVHRYRSMPAGYGLIEEDLRAIERLRGAIAAHRGMSTDQLAVWKWRWSDGRTLTFNGRGLLKTVERPDGRALEVQFDTQRRFSRVTDGYGNWLAATYWDDAAERLQEYTAAAHATKRGTGYRGRLKALTRSSGERIQYEYDARGNLNDVVYPDGTIRRYEYGAGGRDLLSKIFGRDGRLFASYEYDPDGRATRSSHQDHRDDVKVSYQWPGPKQNIGRTTVEDASGTGAKTTYTWRADARAENPEVLKADGPGCRTCAAGNVRYEYDANQRVTKTVRVDAAGTPFEQTVASVDALGRTRTVEIAQFADGKPLAPEWRETREYDGNELMPVLITRPSVVPGREHTVRVDYNERGQPTRIVEKGFEFAEPQGMVRVSLDSRQATAIERTTTLTYTQIHGLSLLHSVDGPLPGAADTTTYQYDPAGRLEAIVHPGHLIERFEHDTWGRVTAHTGLDGVRETLEYSADGNIHRFARADQWMTLAYDAAGRINQVLDSLGQQLTLTRDEAGELVQMADAAGNRIHWAYGERGEVRELTLLNPDGSISQHGHPPAAHTDTADLDSTIPDEAMLSSIAAALPDAVAAQIPGLHDDAQPGTAQGIAPEREAHTARALPGLRTAYDSERRATTYVYDDFGRLTAEHSPVSGTTRFRWDDADHLIERIAADESVTRITRDALGRAIRVRAGAEDGRIEWGAANRPTRVTFQAGEERFEYDAQARLTAHTLLTGGKQFRLAYEFDELGRVLRKRLPDGSVLRYRYNGALHPKPGVLAAIYKEGIVDRPIITDLNAPDERYADRGFTFGNGLSQHRVLDVDGNVVNDGNPQVGQSHLSYAKAALAATYTRTAQVGDAATPDVSPPLNVRLAAGIAEFGQSQDYRAALLDTASYGVSAPHFDVRGRLVDDAERRYEWDGMGRLTRVFKRGASGFIKTSITDRPDDPRPIAEYLYNLFGERIAKRVHGPGGPKLTYFMWDGAELAAEIDQSGKVVRDYVYLDGRPVALLSGRAVYAIHTDHRMAPVAVTDSNRRVVWQADVRDDGAADVLKGSRLELPLRASNQYFDAETGLHYNVYRYLDAQRGRYLSPDPMGLAAGPDLYQFALGQPHVLVDPLGLQTVPLNGNISGWSFQTRLQYVLNQAIPQVPAEIGNVLRSMVSPTNLAITAGVFTAWAVAQLTPAGWIADAAVAGIGYFFLGEAIAQLVMLAVDTYQLVHGATCISDLDKAAKNFAQMTSQVVVNIGAYGATKLADVMGGVFKVKASGVWNLNPFARGVAIEKALGHNVPPSYPTIDIWNNVTGLGTSIKSLDLNAATYQNASALTRTVQGYIDTLKNFNGVYRPSLNTLGKIKSRELDLVVPSDGTAAQQQALRALEIYAQQAGVTLKIILYP